jgi:hypothetical protein
MTPERWRRVSRCVGSFVLFVFFVVPLLQRGRLRAQAALKNPTEPEWTLTPKDRAHDACNSVQ